MELEKQPVIDVGTAIRTLKGEEECGDRHFVGLRSAGVVIAVVDGLGHGKEAADAAALAVREVGDGSCESASAESETDGAAGEFFGFSHGAARPGEPRDASASVEVFHIFLDCHRSLRCTRGVVMSVACYDPAERIVSWMGVGNVQGILVRGNPTGLRSTETLLLRGGVVGSRLPMQLPAILHVESGDVLIFATDGVRTSFAENLDTSGTPQEIADRILIRHSKDNDDALALVARFR